MMKRKSSANDRIPVRWRRIFVVAGRGGPGPGRELEFGPAGPEDRSR